MDEATELGEAPGGGSSSNLILTCCAVGSYSYLATLATGCDRVNTVCRYTGHKQYTFICNMEHPVSPPHGIPGHVRTAVVYMTHDITTMYLF